jgi:acyl-CoA reductase-like NAD-dependent aldehyde dehydrogenase
MTTVPPGVTDRARMTTRPIPSPGNDWPTSALVEEMMDRYIEWRDGAAAAADAYRRWADAPAARRADWFLAYIAALDQEESAAIGFALAVAEVERRMQRDHGRKTEQ